MPKKKKEVRVDTTAGSRSYNRLDMQVSQTLQMAIKLYDDMNYLLVLDHYDDITLFNLDTDPLIVSYYQLKTSDNKITIDSAINNKWISKLYAQLSRPEDWLVKELGLITNLPLEIEYQVIGEDGKKKKKTESLNKDHTSFTKLNQSIQERIKKDIAVAMNIKEGEVDLSKFTHMRTTFSIIDHRDVVENQMSNFLYEKYPKITFDTIKCIFRTMIDLLSRRQEYERLSEDEVLENVKIYKGFERSDFNRVIDQAIIITMPEFSQVNELLKPSEDDKKEVSLAWVTIAADRTKSNNQSFIDLFKLAQSEITTHPYDGGKSIWEYTHYIKENMCHKKPLLCVPYEGLYIPVLVTCLLINEMRRAS